MVTWRAACEGSKDQERVGRGWGGGSEQVGRIPVMEGLKCQWADGSVQNVRGSHQQIFEQNGNIARFCWGRTGWSPVWRSWKNWWERVTLLGAGNHQSSGGYCRDFGWKWWWRDVVEGQAVRHPHTWRLLGGGIIICLPSKTGAPRQWAQTFPCPSRGSGTASLSPVHACLNEWMNTNLRAPRLGTERLHWEATLEPDKMWGRFPWRGKASWSPHLSQEVGHKVSSPADQKYSGCWPYIRAGQTSQG